MLVHTRKIDKLAFVPKGFNFQRSEQENDLFVAVPNAEACVPFRTRVLASLKRSQNYGSLLGSGKVWGDFPTLWKIRQTQIGLPLRTFYPTTHKKTTRDLGCTTSVRLRVDSI